MPSASVRTATQRERRSLHQHANAESEVLHHVVLPPLPLQPERIPERARAAPQQIPLVAPVEAIPVAPAAARGSAAPPPTPRRQSARKRRGTITPSERNQPRGAAWTNSGASGTSGTWSPSRAARFRLARAGQLRLLQQPVAFHGVGQRLAARLASVRSTCDAAAAPHARRAPSPTSTSGSPASSSRLQRRVHRAARHAGDVDDVEAERVAVRRPR